MPNNIMGALAGAQGANSAYNNAADNNWVPPDGTFSAELTGVTGKIVKVQNADVGVLDLTFTILDGEHAGRPFSVPVFQTNPVAAVFMKSVITLLGGLSSNDPAQSFAIDGQYLNDKGIGRSFMLTVKTTKSKKNGKSYPNFTAEQLL